MADPFVGEIRLFAGNFAPRGWALCDGQLLPINENAALFSLLGTYYGGDGRGTFALPDLRGRVPVHQGQGPGLSQRRIGSRGGAETVTLNVAQLPHHSHALQASGAPAAETAAAGHRYAEPEDSAYRTDGDTVSMSDAASTGGGQPHPNLHPQLAVNYIIALVGVYPSRN